MLGRFISKSRRNSRGFTLIELLVVVLILAILMAVALPLYLSAVADSQKKVCRANLQSIANAVQAARVRAMETDYQTEISANSSGITTTGVGGLADLPALPECPASGHYTVSAVASTSFTRFQVNCSIHGTFEPGVDSK